MATTAKGTPYVESSDLVSGYPTVSLNLANHIDNNLAYNATTFNAKTANYTCILSDATQGKVITMTNAAARTITIPPESSVAWPTGSVLRFLNLGAGLLTIAAGSGVTINGTPLTLEQNKAGMAQKTGTDTWTFIPFSGGVGNAVITSPAATGSYSSGGATYSYYRFTSSGTLVVGTTGLADLLVVGGGGGGGTGFGGNVGPGGGAGGMLEASGVLLNEGSITVTVGAGGAVAYGNGNNGNASKLDVFIGPGGGGGVNSGGYNGTEGRNGGSGSGEWGDAANAAGLGISGLGNNGGTGTNARTNAGGGGGASAVGGNGTGTTGGNGGAGRSSSITGSAVTYAGGGGGGGTGTSGTGGSGGGGAGGATTGTAGTANTGGGGGGAATTPGAGGSGIVIVRVRTA